MQLLHSIKVPFPATSQRIDVYLSSKLRKYSRNKISNLIFKKAILVNGHQIDADYKIKAYDQIEVFSPFKEFNSNVTPEAIPLDIMAEDDSLIVVNKSAGMPVHKGLGNYKGTLLNALAYYLQDANPPVNIEEGSVHRLDSGTSGLIVFAKNKAAKRNLEAQIHSNGMHRVYVALVWGVIAADEGIIDVPIGRNKENPMIIQAFPLRDEGKEAITKFKVLQRFRFATLVQCELQSGRTHQLRIHLQHIGHAILGDPRYISAFTFKDVNQLLEAHQVKYQLLHARYLHLKHPLTGADCHFEAPLPPLLANIMLEL